MKYHVRYIYWKLNLALILLSIIFALPASAGINLNYTTDGTPRNYTIPDEVLSSSNFVRFIDADIVMPTITLTIDINKTLNGSGNRRLNLNTTKRFSPPVGDFPYQKVYIKGANGTANVVYYVDASSTFAPEVNVSIYRQTSNNVPFFSDLSVATMNFNDLKNTWNNDSKVLDDFVNNVMEATKIDETTVTLNSTTGNSDNLNKDLPPGNYLVLVTRGADPKQIITSNIIKVVPFSSSFLVGDGTATSEQGSDLIVNITLNTTDIESYTYITSIINSTDYRSEDSDNPANLGKINISWSNDKTLAQATRIAGTVINNANTLTDIIPRSNTTRNTTSLKSANLTLKTGALPAGSYFVHTAVFNSTNLLVAFNQSTLTLTPAVAVGAPAIILYNPPTLVNDTSVPATRTFNITVNQSVNVTWYFNSNFEQTNTSVLANTSVNYTNTTNLIGVHNVTAIASNINGTATQKWDWNVTTTAPYFAIGNVAVNKNEFGTVSLYLNNFNKTGSFDVNVTFNSSIANVTAIAKSPVVEHLVYNITTGMVRIGGFNLNTSLSGNVKLADITLRAVGRQGSSTVLGISVNSLADENVTKDPKNVTGIGIQQESFRINVVDESLPVIKVFAPANNSTIGIFNRSVRGSITDDSSITANMRVRNESDAILTNISWNFKGNFSWLANYTGGQLNRINISATDAWENSNQSIIFVNVLSPTNTTPINLTNNSNKTIDARESTSAGVTLRTGNNTANVTLTINATTNASEFNVSDLQTDIALGMNQKSLSKFIQINVTGDDKNLSRVELTVYYDIFDLDGDGDGKLDTPGKDIKEDTLKLYWYWENATGNQKWFPLEKGKGLMPKGGPEVFDETKQKFNATLGYGSITVDMDHFSTFAIAGTLVAAPSVPTDGDGAGGGGTGGGGVVTSEPFDNIAKYETRSKDLIANTPITYIFTTPEHSIYEIVLTGKESENDIALRVEALKGTSKLVTASAPGVVNKNVNIWAGTKKIKEVLIRFRVENSWITGSNQDSGDVKMLRWDGSKWTQLETIEKTRENTYTYYEAKTDTLSQFAIAGLKGVVVPTVTPTVTVPAVTPTITPTVTVTPPVAKPPGIPAWVYAIIAIAIIAAAVYFLVIKKKGEVK